MLNKNNLTLDIIKGKDKFSVRANVEHLKCFNFNFIVHVEKLTWCLNSIGSISKKQTKKILQRVGPINFTLESLMSPLQKTRDSNYFSQNNGCNVHNLEDNSIKSEKSTLCSDAHLMVECSAGRSLEDHELLSSLGCTVRSSLGCIVRHCVKKESEGLRRRVGWWSPC